MDAIMDLTARTVSFITLIQDTFLKGCIQQGNNDKNKLTPGINDVYGRDFTSKFSNYIQVVKAQEKENTGKIITGKNR